MHEENDSIKRTIVYVNQISRTILQDFKLSPKLWPAAVATIVHVHNRLSRKRNSSLYYYEKEKHSRLNYFRSFDCVSYVNISLERRVKSVKYASTAKKRFLVGYGSENEHIYNVWILAKKKIIRFRDVGFDESAHDSFIESTSESSPESTEAEEMISRLSTQISTTVLDSSRSESKLLENTDEERQRRSETPALTNEEAKNLDFITDRVRILSSTSVFVSSTQSFRRSQSSTKRISKFPERSFVRFNKRRSSISFEQWEFYLTTVVFFFVVDKLVWQVHIPNTFNETMKSVEIVFWKEVCVVHLQKLIEMNIWKIVNFSIDQKATILSYKRVFDLKQDDKRRIIAFRARLVVCENFQRLEIDFDKNIRATVVFETSVKMILAKIAAKSMKTRQYDIVFVYFQSSWKSIRFVWESHQVLMIYFQKNSKIVRTFCFDFLLFYSN